MARPAASREPAPQRIEFPNELKIEEVGELKILKWAFMQKEREEKLPLVGRELAHHPLA